MDGWMGMGMGRSIREALHDAYLESGFGFRLGLLGPASFMFVVYPD
jgi:hypothetical protein